MAFQMEPLPNAFARAAWERIAKDVEAPSELKEQMLEVLLRLHSKSAGSREAVRALGVVVHRTSWGIPRLEQLLSEQLDATPTDEDKLEAIFHWYTLATHKLWRRGQIRAILKDCPARTILVHVGTDEGEVAPCGFKDGERLLASEETLKRIPPCNHPFCSCSWTLG